jgi:hypothetical protein
MSRATWYRRGKPDEKPLSVRYADIAKHDRVSVRTVERMNRVLKADPTLADAVWRGAGKWGQAEWLITNPDAHRKWREANGLPWPVPEMPDEAPRRPRNTASFTDC